MKTLEITTLKKKVLLVEMPDMRFTPPSFEDRHQFQDIYKSHKNLGKLSDLEDEDMAELVENIGHTTDNPSMIFGDAYPDYTDDDMFYESPIESFISALAVSSEFETFDKSRTLIFVEK